jgi:hypothetical protein
MFVLALMLGLIAAAGPGHVPVQRSVAEGAQPSAVAPDASAGAVFADTIHVSRISSATAPAIDGNIVPDEWSASVAYDMSDTAGRGGTRQAAGSCIAYFLYDSVFVYLACDLPNRTIRANGDQFGPYMDENRDGTWSVDSSEGNYWVEYMASADRVIYRALLDTVPHFWEMGVAPGALSASSLTSGHLQFEAEIPIGLYEWQYAVDPGDTVGFFQYAASIDEDTEYVGWWPQTVDGSQWWRPEYYGVMVFDTLGPGIQDRATALAFCGPSASLVRGRANIDCCTGSRASVELRVYDATGALVRTIVSGPAAPGRRTIAWDCTDNSGRRVADGTYFYRLTVGGSSASGKAIVLR